MMSLPRLLNLDPDGTLRVQTLPQLSRLRAGSVPCETSGSGSSTILRRASGEALCTGSLDHEMKFTMSNGATELLSVGYSPEKHAFVADGKEIALEKNDMPKLHAFVDGSVIELILGERVGYTKRFYFTGATAPDISIQTTGPGKMTMNAWKIAPISTDRLTTPAHAV
jgi:beta-fructofuranosidase